MICVAGGGRMQRRRGRKNRGFESTCGHNVHKLTDREMGAVGGVAASILCAVAGLDKVCSGVTCGYNVHKLRKIKIQQDNLGIKNGAAEELTALVLCA